jgi:REP element-mobilizing transposase RayT
LRLFHKEADFTAFEQILGEARARVPLRILAYVVMSNHWHFVVLPRQNQGEAIEPDRDWPNDGSWGKA